MRTIAHISDLHFGRVDGRVAEGLMGELWADRPSLVVVSGDLTQRARREQFREAVEYLGRLPGPVLVVPGNHDVPLYDVGRRMLSPLGRYRKYVTRDLRPLYRDEEMVVLGVSTARGLTLKSGWVTEEQLLDLRLKICRLPEEVFKVVVTHHPFIPAPGEPESDVVRRAGEAIETFEACGVDMVLSGHLHKSYAGDLRDAAAEATRPVLSVLSVHAGTATSTRVRGEPNGYNRIRIDGVDRAVVEVRAWDEGRGAFGAVGETVYDRVDRVWHRAG
jgi:3',5'-cyclic AMP phosphodiesterase CpdA